MTCEAAVQTCEAAVQGEDSQPRRSSWEGKNRRGQLVAEALGVALFHFRIGGGG